jgi:hypothetical protein
MASERSRRSHTARPRASGLDTAKIVILEFLEKSDQRLFPSLVRRAHRREEGRRLLDRTRSPRTINLPLPTARRLAPIFDHDRKVLPLVSMEHLADHCLMASTATDHHGTRPVPLQFVQRTFPLLVQWEHVTSRAVPSAVVGGSHHDPRPWQKPHDWVPLPLHEVHIRSSAPDGHGPALIRNRRPRFPNYGPKLDPTQANCAPQPVALMFYRAIWRALSVDVSPSHLSVGGWLMVLDPYRFRGELPIRTATCRRFRFPQLAALMPSASNYSEFRHSIRHTRNAMCVHCFASWRHF